MIYYLTAFTPSLFIDNLYLNLPDNPYPYIIRNMTFYRIYYQTGIIDVICD